MNPVGSELDVVIHEKPGISRVDKCLVLYVNLEK